MSAEPKNLRGWSLPDAASQAGRLFTCGRPGRATYGTARIQIDEATIHQWVAGLPAGETVHIVSLLGRKPDSFSEFGYYPFRSEADSDPRPTFGEWLRGHYGPRFVVHEFPTTDLRGLPRALLATIVTCVGSLLAQGNVVVVVDSAGSERTARVCKALSASPRSSPAA
jgi:hypothetical protein